ncbi:DUF4595 domain-containing protein [Bacteroides sp.]|uniref:DUF4595 domain-containing protein n=1 Tax=Bacteroides sp. TaxID=29523 RepID=UPI00260827FA|nr:DUF4595 domain-containing protein [Bacteroides sp.]
MKQQLFILLLLTASIFSACKDEKDTQPIISPFPNVSQITLSETISSDGGNVSVKDVYLFTDNKLFSHSTVQEFYGQELTQEINCSYANDKAIFTDNNENIATYTLGSNGYATQCTYQMANQTREYRFIYSNDYLTQIEEDIDGVPYTSITLQYSNGNLQTICNNALKILCETGNDLNKYQLPCSYLSDVYPLSLHVNAIYARLLGKQSDHLVIRTAPENNDKEWTDYIYQLDTNNKPTTINIATTSTGTVYDKYGNQSEVTRTDRRSIKVSIE